MSEIDFEIFRYNLEKIRRVRDISAKQLSADLGLRQLKRISDIEEGKGTPSLEEINAICNFFGYPIDDMMKRRAVVTIQFV